MESGGEQKACLTQRDQSLCQPQPRIFIEIPPYLKSEDYFLGPVTLETHAGEDSLVSHIGFLDLIYKLCLGRVLFPTHSVTEAVASAHTP